jgi:hypothetical protein
MKSRSTSPLWLSAALVVGGALLTFGPSLIAVPEALAERPGSCAPRHSAITPDQPVDAAALADAIWSNPGAAVCTLATHSMDSSSFERVMTEIAVDPDSARRYAEARRLGRRL